MTNLTANAVENITNVIFPSWQKACNSFLESEMHIFDFWQDACNKFLTSGIHILDLAHDYFDKEKEIKEKYSIDENFNIFTAIAEKYRYENLHSDLLKVILGKENNNIKNKKIFYKFLKYIDIDNPEQYFPNYEDIKFHREYPKGIKTDTKIKTPGFIDLLIYTETGKVCIIIENKINGAPDQPDQLGRYRKMMKEEGIEILKTVYLTIDSKHTEPSNFNNYSEDFKVSKEELNFIHLPCVTEENQNNKSFTKFLKEIIDHQKNIGLNDTQRVFIEQYKLLLESIGGQVLMEQYKKDFIKDIMKDTGSIQTATDFANNFKKFWDNKKKHTSGPEKDLVEKIKEKNYTDTANYLAENFNEIWSRRPEIVGKILVDEKDITNTKMEIAPDNHTIRQKKIEKNVFIYYTYNVQWFNRKHEEGNNIEFGFRSPKSDRFDKEIENNLIEILTQLYANTIFKLDSKNGHEDYIYDNDEEKDETVRNWVWLYHHVSDLGDLTYDQIKAELNRCLKFLEDKAKDAVDIK